MSFGTDQVMALTGVTRRQLQWWEQTGVVVPGRSESRVREYSPMDLFRVMILSEFRHKGLSFNAIGRNLPPEIKPEYEFLACDSANRMFACRSTDHLIDLISSHPSPFVVIDLREIRQRVPNITEPVC